jgi:HlyD family secretion protein
MLRGIIAIAAIAAIAAVAAAVVAVSLGRSGRTEAPAGTPAAGASAAALAIDGAPRVAACALGKLEAASEEIGVASDITSRIVAIHVDEGDRVEAGQALAGLDDTVQKARVNACEAAVKVALAHKERLDAGARPESIRKGRATLEEAEARARIARERAERALRLDEKGISSRDETDWLQREAEACEARARAAREEVLILEHETRVEDLAAAVAELERARQELAAAQAELGKTVLRSPIAGTVVRRSLRVGEAVSSFQVEPVVIVADLTRFRVRVEVDEIDIGKVRVGQRVRAESESFPGLRLEGRVSRLGKTMGRKTVKSLNPNERQDVRIREVLADLDGVVDLPLGLRLVVSFLEP